MPKGQYYRPWLTEHDTTGQRISYKRTVALRRWHDEALVRIAKERRATVSAVVRKLIEDLVGSAAQ